MRCDLPAQLGNAMTAMRRLSQFLIMEERSDEVEKLPSPGAIIADGNFYWAEALKTPVRPMQHAVSFWDITSHPCCERVHCARLVHGYMPWRWQNF